MQPLPAEASERARVGDAARTILRLLLVIAGYIAPSILLAAGGVLYLIAISSLGEVGVVDSTAFLSNDEFERIAKPGVWRPARSEDARYSHGHRDLPVERLDAREADLDVWHGIYHVHLVQVRDVEGEYGSEIGYWDVRRNWLTIVLYALLTIACVTLWILGFRRLLRSRLLRKRSRATPA